MIAVPDSVLAYFTQSAIAAAVDMLLAGKRHRVPDTLRWDEVQSYYSACLAARQTPVEYAMLLAQLWTAVWQDGPHGWTPSWPATPARKELAIDVETVWHEGSFSRRFEKDGRTVELYVMLNTAQGGIQAGAWIANERDETMHADELQATGWELHTEWGSFWTPEGLVKLTATVDEAQLLRFREGLWAIVGST